MAVSMHNMRNDEPHCHRLRSHLSSSHFRWMVLCVNLYLGVSKVVVTVWLESFENGAINGWRQPGNAVWTFLSDGDHNSPWPMNLAHTIAIQRQIRNCHWHCAELWFRCIGTWAAKWSVNAGTIVACLTSSLCNPTSKWSVDSNQFDMIEATLFNTVESSQCISMQMTRTIFSVWNSHNTTIAILLDAPEMEMSRASVNCEIRVGLWLGQDTVHYLLNIVSISIDRNLRLIERSVICFQIDSSGSHRKQMPLLFWLRCFRFGLEFNQNSMWIACACGDEMQFGGINVINVIVVWLICGAMRFEVRMRVSMTQFRVLLDTVIHWEIIKTRRDTQSCNKNPIRYLHLPQQNWAIIGVACVLRVWFHCNYRGNWNTETPKNGRISSKCRHTLPNHRTIETNWNGRAPMKKLWWIYQISFARNW